MVRGKSVYLTVAVSGDNFVDVRTKPEIFTGDFEKSDIIPNKFRISLGIKLATYVHIS